MGQNITKVYLLNVPLESDYQNTLYFASKEEQQSYFESKIVKSYTDFSYQRKEHFIRVPEVYDNLMGCNYVMYQNSAYNNKWFYAFIDKIEFKSDEKSDVFINTDVMQTWMFDINVKPSFVEREHTNDDSIGSNLLPENLDIGDYIYANTFDDENLKTGDCYYILASTKHPVELNTSVGGEYNGIYSGVRYYFYRKLDMHDISEHLIALSESDETVSALFMAPKVLIDNLITDEYTSFEVPRTTDPMTYDVSVLKDTEKFVNNLNVLDEYVPKNNKLFTYPYKLLMVSNGSGLSAEYKYEHFSTERCNFKVYGALTPGCSIRMIPQKYKGHYEHECEGLNLGKYPICNWFTDLYTNWQTQQAVNTYVDGTSNAVNGIIGALIGMATGGPVGTALGVASAVNSISAVAKTLNTFALAEKLPAQARGNTNCGDVVTSMRDNTFHFYQMSIKPQYARIIDDFFSMFGYRTDIVKIPNKNHRKEYWYTKTINVNITGAVPNEDMRTIKDCYNNGITFWKNPANIKDYSVDNGIL